MTDVQTATILQLLGRYDVDIQRNLFLRHLQRVDPALFYRVLLHATEEVLPYLYTPTIATVCQRYFHLPLVSYGLWLTADDAQRKETMLERLQAYPQQDIQVIVVTDGERVLGIGDQGAGGMGICEGKSLLYTAAAGVAPQRIMPVHIDVGTNNKKLLEDPVYPGLRHKRITGQAYEHILQTFIEALHAWKPHVLLQFEDFANHTAFDLLHRYGRSACCFNDDIQGTACIALAALLAALRASNQSLSGVRIMFLGAGEAGTGIADLIALALHRDHGIPLDQARQHCIFLDSKGLVCDRRTDLQPHKRPYAHNLPPCNNLLQAIRTLRPAALIGVSTIKDAFTQEILEEMAAINPQPIIFPLSNPTVDSECTFVDAVAATQGTLLFASGSPFPPCTNPNPHPNTHPNTPIKYPNTDAHHTMLKATQANNAYVFPAIGYAAVLTRAAYIPEDVFLVVAKALAGMTGPKDWAQCLLLPSFSTIRDVSARLMVHTCMYLIENGIGSIPEDWDRVLADLRVQGKQLRDGDLQGCWDGYVRAKMYEAPCAAVARL